MTRRDGMRWDWRCERDGTLRVPLPPCQNRHNTLRQRVLMGLQKIEMEFNMVRMVALELGKKKLAGEAGTHAKRLIGQGYGTAHGLSELDVEDLVDRDAKRGCKTSNGAGVSKVHVIRGGIFFETWRRFWERLDQWITQLGGHH